MRMTSLGRLYLAGGEEVFRDPGLWDKFKWFLGSDVDLRTGEWKVTRDMLRLTEEIQRGLEDAGVNNAVSLVVDTDVVFQDTEGVDEDAELLVQAMRKAHDRFSSGFKTLRALFEHHSHGMSTLIEVTVRAQYEADAPAATIAVGSRIDALRPHASESIEAAKDRIGKRLADTQLVPTHLQLVNNLCADLLKGMKAHFPQSVVEFDPAMLQVVRPSAASVRGMRDIQDNREPTLLASPVYPRSGYYGPYYDPWSTYYSDPVDTYVNLLVIDAMLQPKPAWGYTGGHLGTTWAHHGAPAHMVSYQGAAICDGDQLLDHQSQFSVVSDVVALDFDSADWDDDAADLYAMEEVSWAGYGSDSSGTDYDCAGYSSSSSSSSSWDCSSDCSWDCSSDCSWDCSSDCSWDCSSDSDW